MNDFGGRNGGVLALAMQFAGGNLAEFGKDFLEESVDVLGVPTEVGAEALCKGVLVRHQFPLQISSI
jgi:hypothetical protein